MRAIRTFVFFTALLGVSIAARALPTIELTDGSRIQGEIQSLDKGVYTVRTASLGTVQIAQSSIARIVYTTDAATTKDAATPASPRNSAMTQEIQQLQASLAKDPATLQSIMNLQSDPQIQAIINDPAIMKAVQEGDYASLMDNPKIQALENDEHVRQLLQQAH